jgi:hypothetical protein
LRKVQKGFSGFGMEEKVSQRYERLDGTDECYEGSSRRYSKELSEIKRFRASLIR